MNPCSSSGVRPFPRSAPIRSRWRHCRRRTCARASGSYPPARAPRTAPPVASAPGSRRSRRGRRGTATIHNEPVDAPIAATMMVDSPGIGRPADSPNTSRNRTGYPTDPLTEVRERPNIAHRSSGLRVLFLKVAVWSARVARRPRSYSWRAVPSRTAFAATCPTRRAPCRRLAARCQTSGRRRWVPRLWARATVADSLGNSSECQRPRGVRIAVKVELDAAPRLDSFLPYTSRGSIWGDRPRVCSPGRRAG